MAPPTASPAKKTPAKGKKTGAAKKAIVKKEPGTRAPKHVVPNTAVKRLAKLAGNAHTAAATPAAVFMFLDTMMLKVAEQAHLHVSAEGKRTITEEHMRAACKQVGVSNLL